MGTMSSSSSIWANRSEVGQSPILPAYPLLERTALFITADVTLQVRIALLHSLELILVRIDELEENSESIDCT